MDSQRPTIGVVILTMGQRPQELHAAVDSVCAQRGVDLDCVVVGNGWEPEGLPVRGVGLAENVGIPAGRNAGVPMVSGELLFFLDDDALIPDPDFLRTVADMFAQDPTLGLVQPRVMDPTGIPAPGRWVPRLRTGDPGVSGPATSLWEGATVIRRSVFERTGGWPAEFFYGHEGIDLVWRVWDAGYVAWYAGDLVVHHPVIDPRRHAEFFHMNARNRVWLARRNLPVILEPLYVGSWVGITWLRVRDRKSRNAWFAGLREGMEKAPAERRPMRWSTVWKLTKAGRPPVI